MDLAHWEVQSIEVAEIPILEDVRMPTEDRSGEKQEKLPINEDGSRFFLVGSSLTQAKQDELFGLLTKYIEVFAWTPQEMHGVDPSFVSHHLNVDPNRKPVMQRIRRSTPMHVDAVMEEIDQLL